MIKIDDLSLTNALKRVMYSMETYVTAYEYELHNFLNEIIDQSTHSFDLNDKETTKIVIKNFLVESLLLHVRNIMDFFYSTKVDVRSDKKDDENSDIRIFDFTCEPREIFNKDGVLYKTRGRINKFLSHLTVKKSI